MNRLGFFDLSKELFDLVYKGLDRDSLWPEMGKARNGAVRAGSPWLVLLLGIAILGKLPEADAATVEQPSASSSEPLASVTPSSPASAAQWLAEASRCLDVKDFAKALALFQKSAAVGRADAMDHLGLLYRDGQGVTQDYGEARAWFQNAIDAGAPSGMIDMGWLSENGWGVAQDYEKAQEWYRKATEADPDNTKAMTHLGWLYETGQGGAQDTSKALECYRRAAEGGDAD